jgi:peptidoglycan/xylan/chitin deacetylase (PgdA/CDA1 family)
MAHVDPTRVPPLKPRAYYVAADVLERLRALRARLGGPSAPTPGLRILGYHRIARSRDVLAVTPERFRRQLGTLLDSGVRVVRLEDALPMLAGPIAEPHVSITFDDGYLDTLETATPILEEFDLPATVYVPTELLSGRADYYWYRNAQPAAMSPDELAELTAGGVFDVQSHSRTHPRLPALDEWRAREEIAGSRADLERHLGSHGTSFSYPAGLFGPREAALVAEAGYRAGVSTRTGVNPGGEEPWGLRRTMISWADDLERFRAKITGRLDTPPIWTELAQWRRRRARAR